MMGTHKLLLMKTQFVNMSRKMVYFIRVLLWVSFFTYLFNFFGVFGRHIFRLQGKFFTRKRSVNLESINAHNDQVDSNLEEEEEDSESLLRFHFRTFEEFVQNTDVFTDDNPNEMSFRTTDMISEQLEEIDQPQDIIGDLSNEIGEDFELTKNDSEFGLDLECVEEKLEEIGSEIEGERGRVDDNSMNNVQSFRQRTDVLSDDESLVSESDSDSSFRSSFIDSLSEGFLSDIDFERAFEIDTLMEYGPMEWKRKSEFLTDDIELRNLSKGYGSDDNLEDEDEDLVQELKNLESNLDDNTETLESNLSDVNDISDTEVENNLESDVDHRNMESNLGDVEDVLGTEDATKTESELESTQNSEKSSSGEQLSSESDEQNELEREWEHQDLLEQLKMEIKKVRAIGLPTILEESESPKLMDDLKPWKINEKFRNEGTMDELHKFYKCYRERMRKLDILNYQKMYAIGFLKLKDPLKSFTKTTKASTTALAAIVSVDCWPCKPKPSSKTHPPPMKQFSKELESDLETVYVAQMCLSWEFLRWEYGKALELWESDPHGIRHYNDVADKFQTFQVVITRFLEDEPFQGRPRVQHYVKNRCVRRSLLQVPPIRDDSYKDRKKERKEVSIKDAITSLHLVEIIEKSIRILWQFIRSDHDTSNVVLVNCRRSYNVELLNPGDAKLLARVRSTLHKKYKKLKELRSEKCIIKNLQTCQAEEGSDDVLYFFARVNLKLVSRVLNMWRISTEQLVWCNDALKKINFVDRKLHFDSSILLFPSS
ncbi:hypothetical protein vseg_008717 [Gypsophila vaccaria]